jgi:ABC-2 type transport system ATP-binding protein
MPPVLSLSHVTKRFEDHVAVRDLSFEVPQGGIFGLLGPNGAGKSTSIRMMMNIITPDEGSIAVLGQPASRHLAPRIGFLPEERGLYKKMKVLEHLIFFGEIKGLSRHDARTRSVDWLDRLGLAQWADKPVEELSKGMQQKVQFIGTLLHEPELLVLDEPFSGLDPVNSRVMKEAVVDIARQGRTVLFSTHIMEQAEQLCERIVIIARGEKVVDGAVRDIKREAGTRHLLVGVTEGQDVARRILSDRRWTNSLLDSGATWEADLASDTAPDVLLRALVEGGVGVAQFSVEDPSLESIFISRVGAEAATAERSEATHGA